MQAVVCSHKHVLTWMSGVWEAFCPRLLDCLLVLKAPSEAGVASPWNPFEGVVRQEAAFWGSLLNGDFSSIPNTFMSRNRV